MTVMPSPVDMRIWVLSRTLGWPGRRVASEVGVSQPTVVRTLERLKEEPPTEQEIQEFLNTGGTSSTPPRGLPAIKGRIRPRAPQIRGGWAGAVGAICFILVCLAVAAVLSGLTVRLVSPTPPPLGQIACLRYSPNGDIAAIGTIIHGACPKGEYAVTIVQNP